MKIHFLTSIFASMRRFGGQTEDQLLGVLSDFEMLAENCEVCL